MSAFPPKRLPVAPVPLGTLPDQPLISIVIPSFNQGRFIRDTIDSILKQDYRPLQIHVIDGASTDETIEVLESYGDIPELDWLSEPDEGVVDAVNKGFAKVQGDIVAIQSSDDRYLPDALKIIVSEFLSGRSNGLGLIYGDTVKVDVRGTEIQRYRIGPWSLENLFLLKTWIPQPSCFFRRELLEACGGWDESIPYAPDTDLWIRMAFRTQVRKIDAYLSDRRIHEAQRDTQAERILHDYRTMIDQSPDIAVATPALRRAARASSELLYRRYNPSGSYARALWHDFKAVVICPKAFDAQRWWTYGVVIPVKILMRPLAPFKHWLGCWAHERWRTELALSSLANSVGSDWRDLCNRHEVAERGDDARARHVKTKYTSYLTVARMFPKVGGRLAKECFAEYPLPSTCNTKLAVNSSPQISVVLPVGGADRLRNFGIVLSGLMNQSLKAIEIIVLEHSTTPLYEEMIPKGVQYQHVSMNGYDEKFNKSKLLNLGVAHAVAPAVLLHDADILVPRDYLEQSLERIEAGYEAVRPMRFLFYLDEESTDRVSKNNSLPVRLAVESVAQNSQGGSTLLLKSVYQAIGGHDEKFEGWGGEDLEFLERLHTRKLFSGGFMPAVHLWHPAAENKANGDQNLEILSRLRAIEPIERINRLRVAGQ